MTGSVKGKMTVVKGKITKIVFDGASFDFPLDQETAPLPDFKPISFTVWMDNDWGDVGRCDRCNNLRPVRWAPDPFLTEVSPEDNPAPSWWCRPCYEARANDI